MALGVGRLPDDAFVFGAPDGNLITPDKLTRDWRRALITLDLPRVSCTRLAHARVGAHLRRHNIVTTSRRLGHGSPAITLAVYAHLFHHSDETAAKAIDAILGL